MSDARPERQELVKVVKQWVEKAEEDLRSAEHLSKLEPDCPFATVSFHAQQCAEKYLKALLAWLQIPIKKVHDIAALIELLPEAQRPALEREAQDRLSRYAVATRYPLDERPLSREQAEAALSAARLVRERMRAALPGEAFQLFPLTLNAVYEDGVFKLERPLPLAPGTRVRLSIEEATQEAPPPTVPSE